jgi:beta-lactamase regulating signal transducer with metallopeptidase domain
MNLINVLISPTVVLLLKWTGLLILAWCAHGFLRRRDARWRLILWRSILCFSLLLPLFQYLELPGLKIPIRTTATEADISLNQTTITATGNQTAKANVESLPNKRTAPIPLAQDKNNIALRTAPAAKVISMKEIITTIWLVGCLAGIARLAWLQLALMRLRKNATAATAEIEQMAAQIAATQKIRQKMRIRTTGAISSPFVCDLLRPTVMLPQKLVESLTPAELGAVLNHEMAHIRRHDLIWCVAWQWLKAFCWFHPLVWRVPAAHNLACEQEADRVASGQMAERDSYAQLLARLALKVLALPSVETRLTVNGSSQIAKRLHWLGQRAMVRWNWRYSVAAFGLSFLLFFAVAGCHTTRNNSTGTVSPAKVEFKQVLVVVQDEDGKPIEGATISPEGFRVKGLHRADANPWRKDLFGPPEKVVTDSDGKAYIKYPVEGIPEEKEYTGELYFSVTHPDYATARPQEYSVDTPEKPIQLTRGIHLKVSGHMAGDHQSVPELAPMLNEEGIHSNDWQKSDGNVYAFNRMSSGGHLLQLMGRLPSGQIVYSEVQEFQLMGRLSSGQIVYSDVQEFTAEKGKDYNFDLEMKPGIRVEGRLDDNVPRPVTNGRVVISVRPKEFPAWTTNRDAVNGAFEKFPNYSFWKSYRLIAPDGTFLFESVPPGELDVIVHGDGFASKDEGSYVNGFGVPQAFPLEAPTTRINVATEPTATLVFTAKTKDQKPVEGAWVSVNPNVIRIGGIFGNLRRSSEHPFNQLPPLPSVPYSAKTDKDGIAVIPNVPACTSGLSVEHPQFQVPLQEPKGWRNRYVRVSFKAGETNRLTMVLEPKGSDFIGTAQ